MSSILKALKKLEQEDSTAGTDTPTTWPDTVQMKRTERADRRKRVVRRCCATALVGAGILVAVWAANRNAARRALTSAPQQAPTPMHRTVPTAETQRAASTSVTNRPDTSAIARTQGVPPQRPPAGKEAPRERLPSPPAASGDFATANRARPPQTSAAAQLPKIVAPPQPAPRVGKPDAASHSKTGAGDERDSAGRQKPQLSSFEDTKIDLQAIAWSADPDGRFAVINNRIVREGQTVEGYTVMEIYNDEVHFRDGQREWRQVFKIR